MSRPEGGVTLRPHDADGATLQDIEVHCVKGTLGWKKEERKFEFVKFVFPHRINIVFWEAIIVSMTPTRINQFIPMLSLSLP